MSIVWSVFLDRNLKLCAMALADWCNDDGKSLHPSVKAVAERMSASRRTAQRALHTLIDMNLLEVTENAAGGAPGFCRHYHLRLDRIAQLPPATEIVTANTPTGDRCVTGVTADTGVTGDRDGCQDGPRRVSPVTETGDTLGTLSVIEPPKNHHRTTNAREALPDWLPADAWNGFIDMRKRQRKAPTARAETLLLAQLAKLRDAGHDPGEVLDRSTTNSWTGLFPVSISRHPPAHGPPPALSRSSAKVRDLTGRSSKSQPETIDVTATERHPRRLG